MKIPAVGGICLLRAGRARRLSFSAAALAFAVTAAPAAAQTTGGDLLDLCQHYEPGKVAGNQITEEQFGQSMGCIGYIKGAVDVLGAILEASGERCPALPNNLSYEQAIRIIIQFLQNNPQKHHVSAGSISIAALINAFPCAN